MGKVAILDKKIVQANPLIEARKYMNLSELRLFCLGLQDVRPYIKDGTLHDVEFRETFISYAELLDVFNNNDSGIRNLKKHIKTAFDGKIEIKIDGNGSFMLLHIYQKLVYKEGEGLLIKFDSEMKSHILDILGQAYTSYSLRTIFPLSSEYAWRLLELLLKQQGHFKKNDKVYVRATIEELRFWLNVPEGLYKKRIDNFRSRVLDVPIKDINGKTPYFVWYEVEKRGRKVSGFKIWMRYKDNAALEVEEELPALPASQDDGKGGISRAELAKEMLAEGMPEKAINSWFKRDGFEAVSASWRLAVEHADGRTETHGKGIQRKKYLKACMERNIAKLNEDDARIKAEIDAREKRLAEEKKRHQKEDTEALGKLGISVDRKGRSIDEIVKNNPSLAGLARLKKKALHEEPQEGKTKTVEEQLEEHGQQRLFEDENGDIFENVDEKKSFKNELKKILAYNCSDDEKVDKILSIKGDDESGNLLKLFTLLLEKSETINRHGHREIKL